MIRFFILIPTHAVMIFERKRIKYSTRPNSKRSGGRPLLNGCLSRRSVYITDPNNPPLTPGEGDPVVADQGVL